MGSHLAFEPQHMKRLGKEIGIIKGGLKISQKIISMISMCCVRSINLNNYNYLSRDGID